MAFIKSIQDPYEPGRTLDSSYWQPNVVSINQRAQTIQIEFDGYASAAAYAANPAKMLDTKILQSKRHALLSGNRRRAIESARLAVSSGLG